MSLGGAAETSAEPTINAEGENVEEEVQEDDDELQMALQLSMGGGAAEAGESNAGNSDFINQLLGSVGVDQDDPLVRAALEQLAQSQGSQDEKRPAPGDNGNESKKKREE
jgi:hypothetical protein